MDITLTYDMRAPSFGASRSALFSAALDQVEWADELGFDVVGLGEHHCSADGYNPSPLPLACAMAARTQRIKLRTSVLLAPLYDPVKLAEDAAVTQIISNGRLLLGIGAGYRPAEFESFDRQLDDRWQAMGEVCEFLRQAWTGAPFEWKGRTRIVTPRPEPFAPPILLGGSSAAAARRAAHIADGWFPPLDERLWTPYREECLKLRKPDPGSYPQHGPIFLWVSHDTEQAWERLFPHVLHQIESYNEWTEEAFGKPAGPYASKKSMTLDMIKQSAAYQVLTPDEVLRLVENLGEHSVLFLNPLLAGIDPEFSWQMLKLYEREVHPYLSR
jgi:alkanesulfonate monooxygenase SsuD/methylene tetrahydromethanopterin reductase-like flavin-dependent oxidoreductase (luciferase family)